MIAQSDLKADLRIGDIINTEKILRATIAPCYVAKSVDHSKGHGTLVQNFNGLSIDQALTIKNLERSSIAGLFFHSSDDLLRVAFVFGTCEDFFDDPLFINDKSCSQHPHVFMPK